MPVLGVSPPARGPCTVRHLCPLRQLSDKIGQLTGAGFFCCLAPDMVGAHDLEILMLRRLVALAMVMIAALASGRAHTQAPFNPLSVVEPGIRSTVERLANYQLRLLGATRESDLTKEQYDALFPRYFCFMNLMAAGSKGEVDRQISEFAELISLGRGPCEGYAQDGGGLFSEGGSVRFRVYARKPASPLLLR